ncbi:carboxypeptidase-like regulatory domain-containing protein, partial [Longimicrobium sp.]|uniref:carboxypeptidase-like regulatory domain-containing protein n=1 Tax=Longimicrobium sp. TaxID=2029185 RepID=UPI002E33207A
MHAQPGAGAPGLSGRVLDRDQGGPISQAVVRVTSGTGLSRADTSDAEGRYAVPFPEGGGPFLVRAERLGYRAL